MQELIERVQLALRNRARQKLVTEYGQNLLRNKRIIAALGMLEAKRDIEAMAQRIMDEWPVGQGLHPQAHVVAGRQPWEVPENHFQSDLKHFRQDFCGATARGVVEDDVGVDGLAGQWDKPVQVQP